MTLDKSKWKGQPMIPYSDEWQGIKPTLPRRIKPTKIITKLAKVCARCGTDKNLTKDHIVPLVVLRAMGIPCTNSKNIQILCQKCNATKGSQLDPKNPRTRPLMLYYLDRWSDLYQVPRKRRLYVFRNLPVKSLTPDTYHFVEAKEALRSIYQKQIKRV